MNKVGLVLLWLCALIATIVLFLWGLGMSLNPECNY